MEEGLELASASDQGAERLDNQAISNYRSLLSNACFLDFPPVSDLRRSSTAVSNPGPKLRKCLSFKKLNNQRPAGGYQDVSWLLNNNNEGSLSYTVSPEKPLKIKAPYKVLKTPCLKDDFYLNLLDWSSNNFVAIGLGQNIYLWSLASEKASNFTSQPSPRIMFSPENENYLTTALVNPLVRDSYTSLRFSPDSQYLALGTSAGETEIWDFARKERILSLKNHAARISSIAWKNNNYLACGSLDQKVSLFDIRCKKSPEPSLESNNYLHFHKHEVCGLSWSSDGEHLASGGNDNKVFVYSARNLCNPLLRINKHTAAVKALAWSPYQRDILCSGGGNNDKMIRVWSMSEAKEIDCFKNSSQICNMSFGPASNPWDIVVANGFPNNDIVVWDLKRARKKLVFEGHSNRVVYMSKNQDCTKFVTASGDELMKFWNVFGSDGSLDKSHLSIGKLDLR